MLIVCAVVVCGLFASATAQATSSADAEQAGRELVDERTATSETFTMPGGGRLTRLAADPIHWKDGQGRWRKFDFRLRKEGATYAATMGRTRVELPTALDDGLSDADATIVSDGDGQVSALRPSFGAGDEPRHR